MKNTKPVNPPDKQTNPLLHTLQNAAQKLRRLGSLIKHSTNPWGQDSDLVGNCGRRFRLAMLESSARRSIRLLACGNASAPTAPCHLSPISNRAFLKKTSESRPRSFGVTTVFNDSLPENAFDFNPGSV